MQRRGLLQRVRDVHRRRIAARHEGRVALGYPAWIAANDSLDQPTRAALSKVLSGLPARPEIGVLIDASAAPQSALDGCLQALHAQLYPHWQQRLLPVGESTPAAWWQAAQTLRTPWLITLSAEDRLAPHALLLLVQAALHFEQARAVYADHDGLDAQGGRCRPWFKSDWNPALLRACNYVAPLVMFEAKALRAAQGTVPEGDMPTLQHALALHLTRGAGARHVVHVPHVLAHTPRALPASTDAARWFVEQQAAAMPTTESPLVSVIVPTRDGLVLLRRCLQGVLEQTAWPRLEVIVVDNGSVESTTLDYLQALQARDARVRVLRDERPFNFSALNNLAAREARGDYLLLLNNDIEVIEPGWLAEMVGLAQRPGTGAVGARLWYPDGSLQHAGLFTGIGGVVGDAHRRLPRGSAGHQSRAVLVQEFSAVTAACLLVKKSLYDEVGGLDETHFAVAYNDVDFCLRLQRAGYHNLWTPNAQLVHHESASRGRDIGNDSDPIRAARFQTEFDTMRSRWGDSLAKDPFYNPNLSLSEGAFQLAEPPRVSLLWPWFADPAQPPAVPR